MDWVIHNSWVVIGVYGPINLMVDLFLGEFDVVGDHWNLPCCVGGDFNEIIYMEERFGNRTILEEWRDLAILWIGGSCGYSDRWGSFHLV